MSTIKSLIIAVIAVISLTSCSNDGRMMKKFIARQNAHEYNASSKYIYPGDHPKLYLYSQIAQQSPNTYFKLQDKQNLIINGADAILVTLQVFNPTPYYINYMKSIGKIDEGGSMIVDTIYIKKVDGRDYLSFNWATIDGESLKSATIGNENVTEMNIRSGMGANFSVVGKLSQEGAVIIDDYSENPEWVKCVAIDRQCNVVEGYIYKKSLSVTNSKFFDVGVFNGMGLFLAFTIFLILAIIPFCIYGVVGALTGSPFTILLAVALVIGWLWIIYQVIENILFELFIINLPG